MTKQAMVTLETVHPINDAEPVDSLIAVPTPLTNDDPPAKVSPAICRRFSGILYALLAACLFTSSTFVTKQLKVDLLDVLIPRFIVQTALLLVYMKFIKHYSFYKYVQKQELFLLIVNVFFAITGFLGFFLGYRYLPLSDLTTIRYSQVIWTAIITAIIYREKPSIPIIFAILLTTIGVVFVAQPKFLFGNEIQSTESLLPENRHHRVLGIAIALYCSVAITLIVVSNRHLLVTYKTRQSLIMLQFTFGSMCVVIINLAYRYYFIIDWLAAARVEFLHWRYLAASSVCLLQILSSILTQKAIKREHPSVFTIVQSSDILFSILLQNIFTSHRSNLISLTGSILVLTSILIVGGFKFFKDRRTKPPPSDAVPVDS